MLLTNCSSNNQLNSDLNLSNRYYRQHIKPIQKKQTEYLVLISAKGCIIPCYEGYIERLFKQLNNVSFVSGKKNINLIKKNYPLDTLNLSIIRNESAFDNQYFMRNELVVLKIDTQNDEAISFLNLNTSNIDNVLENLNPNQPH